MDLGDIQKQIDREMHKQNNRPISDFEGYSPLEMQRILYFTFEPDSPIKLQKLSESDYKKIPMLNQIKYLLHLIDKKGELKLTQKGFLPTKVVSELYHQGFIKEEFIENGISKLYKETDADSINLTRILIELAGLTKKRHGKLSLTKSSKKILADNHELFRQILLAFTGKFNWAYYDGYGDNEVGRFGAGFSMILLSKYGHKPRPDSFYAEKYFKAFPQLLETLKPTYDSLENYAANCYSLRTFNRFLDYFGLITIDGGDIALDSVKYISKTDLYDRLIKCMPHKTYDNK